MMKSTKMIILSQIYRSLFWLNRYGDIQSRSITLCECQHVQCAHMHLGCDVKSIWQQGWLWNQSIQSKKIDYENCNAKFARWISGENNTTRLPKNKNIGLGSQSHKIQTQAMQKHSKWWPFEGFLWCNESQKREEWWERRMSRCAKGNGRGNKHDGRGNEHNCRCNGWWKGKRTMTVGATSA